jgi:sec-independent protein translocase protein TatC
MATALRPIGHEDRLTIVDHLDELRSRLFICAATLAVAFAFCFWQNNTLLEVLNEPLMKSTPTVEQASGRGRLARAAQAQLEVQRGLSATARSLRVLARSPSLAPAERRALAANAETVARAAEALPKTVPERVPITTGVAEPFTVTLGVAAYFALLFALPVLLYQAYAFILPAFSPQERRVALPLMMTIPFLFLAGVAFGYYLVLPPAISFLQNFNDTNFDVLLQAREYYRFELLGMLATGLVFQLPVGLLAANAVGVLSAKQLRSSWRYSVVGIAVVAAVLPGVDPVTTVILMVPLLLLYGLSILLLTIADKRRGDRSEIGSVQPAHGDENEGT